MMAYNESRHNPFSRGESQSSPLDMPIGCEKCQVSSVESDSSESLIYSIIAGILK